MNKEGKITFRVKEDKENVVVEIEDSGKGIPDSLIEKIFDPLFTTKQIGTGLGLASCQSIIEAHGGKIDVQNNPTVFKILLPKKPQKNINPIKREFVRSSWINNGRKE